MIDQSSNRSLLRSRKGRLFFCLILVVLTLHADTSPALACSPGPGYYPATIAELVHAADFVLEATVDVFDDKARYPDTGNFTVHQWLKGNGPTRVIVTGFGNGANCSSPIPGGKAVLFATGNPSGVMQLHYVGAYSAVMPDYPPYIAEVIDAVRLESTLPQPPSTPEPLLVVHMARPQPCWLQSLRCLRPESLVIPGGVILLMALGLGLVAWKRRNSLAKLWQRVRRHWRAVGFSVLIIVVVVVAGLGLYHFAQQHQLPLSCLPNCAYADLRTVDLSDLDLSGGDFNHAHLEGAYLSSAKLHGVNLTASSLQGAKLYNADLSQAVLKDADLTDATLSGVDLRGTDFTGATLKHVQLANAKIDETTRLADKWRSAARLFTEKLTGPNLRKADLSETNLFGRALTDIDLTETNLSQSMLQGTRWMTATLDRADLHGAILTAASLHNFSLREANLEGADLRYAVFVCYESEEACDLRGANLKQANLDFIHVDDLNRADFRGADLRGASLNGVDLRGLIIDDKTQLDEKWRQLWEVINLPQARRKLPGGDLSWSLLQNANLQEADLSTANLFRADLSTVNLNRANLRGANLQGAVLTNADLIGADLRDADLRWADLSNAALSNVVVNDHTQLDPKWLLAWEIVQQPQSGRDLTGMDLSWTSLSTANLANAKLSGADLSYTHIYRANLQNADLSGANLSETDWTDVDLDTADLAHVRLCDTKWEVNLRSANLQTAYLCNASLSGSRYNSATQWPSGFDPVAAELILR